MFTLKLLIKADRNGNWRLHVSSVGALLHIFLQADSYKYLYYGTICHELIKDLPLQSAFLYQQFTNGSFVAKTKNRKFNYVAVDMKLEQTIQRVSKSTKGIIG